jgi:ketosteroid isomerase-like protein
MKKQIRIAALIVVAGAVSTYFAVQYLTTDEERVARVVRSILGAMEDRDRTGICQHMTTDYHDGHGHGSRADLRETLRGLPIVRSISTRYEDLQIKVSGDEATAEFVGTVTASQAGRARPWTHRSRVRLHLRKDPKDDAWRVYEAEYNIPAGVLRSLRMAE